MNQVYPKKGFVEFSLIDDGISIPGNFKKHNLDFKEDADAINMALKEQSTKVEADNFERGYGLSSSLSMYCLGAKAEAMIVSRGGLYYQKFQKSQLYSLKQDQKFPGTMISIRTPIDANIISIYKYLEM